MYSVLFIRRKALTVWKQNKGNQATFENLIKAFEKKGYKLYADHVRKLCEETTSGGDGGTGACKGETGEISFVNRTLTYLPCVVSYHGYTVHATYYR